MKEKAKEARRKVLELIFRAQTSHIASNFSCIDILTVLFEKIDLEKDKFILSAGWKAASLYYFLWKKGKITEEELNSYCQPESKFIGLAEPIIPEIPFSGGSMGLGFPAAVGFALAKKLKGEEGNIYVLMSDGELQCGTTWEASLIARHHELNNLMVIIDYNEFQAMGKTEDILKGITHVPNLDGVWVDGHDYEELEKTIIDRFYFNDNAFTGYRRTFGPVFVGCNTIKGKGVSFMENNNLFHYKAPSKEEYQLALKELT